MLESFEAIYILIIRGVEQYALAAGCFSRFHVLLIIAHQIRLIYIDFEFLPRI